MTPTPTPTPNPNPNPNQARPLRPLTILDFWLDNLMANIPALCVCGHVDGAVKGYQVLKTEDLPRWPGAAFDATAVLDNASNPNPNPNPNPYPYPTPNLKVLDNAHALLSFLHAHCTRPGGSYWVLKPLVLARALALTQPQPYS